MSAYLNLRSFFSTCIDRHIDEVDVFFEWVKADEMIQKMRARPDKVYFIITHDPMPGPLAEHAKLDHMLSDEKEKYTVFMTYCDFLEGQMSTADLKNFNLLPWCHNTQSNIRSLRWIKHDIGLRFMPKNHSKKWLSLNRGITDLRKYFHDRYLVENPDIFEYSFGRHKFFGSTYDFYDNRELSPDICNVMNFMSLHNVYNNTCGSIIHEGFDFTSITEKTIHGFVAMHPLLIIGHPNTVKYLRQQGFDMFDDILDHSYDDIKDDRQRIDTMISLNWDVLNNGLDRAMLVDRLEHNRCNVWSYFDNSLAAISDMIKKSYNT